MGWAYGVLIGFVNWRQHDCNQRARRQTEGGEMQADGKVIVDDARERLFVRL